MTPAVTLTFDDGPDPVWTPAVLDALDAAGARATFFVIAPRAAAHPALLERMHRAGHTVELHCDRHVRHTELREDQLAADTVTALARLDELGVRPRLWRAPWGITTPASEAVARAHGLRLVHWTADTEDWAGHAPDTMLRRVEDAICDGAVVLAHDGLGPGATRTGCANTVAVIGPLAALAADRGLRCEPLTSGAVATP
ncbi:polysaccharide deacetylase family protein [Paraconexibacter antarcticus]|uniref:Polysaccharide deacetylase family protein n=1 Tax=Paraconexibacter antarcticus TaxID=2949664 RepID=A0ABY5DZU3_9ACTN|nr:polysaccharide deacetylase family protein [Paraconexibacter antarcticus]UTI66084.1 polysaccharide deacetylase family protein [Paraconexibacter antarcticus]